MGFFTNFFGMDGKEQLIRSLLKENFRGSFNSWLRPRPEYAKNFIHQLMGHAEATIVTCVQIGNMHEIRVPPIFMQQA